ncbi:MAG: hypothetical protein IPF87_23095 [Gemmatimonadetes bacterium]|nr:hypothetical protein [Gemmatimonadota bacterium]
MKTSEIARVKLRSAQAEAARLAAINAEMELRQAEIALLELEMATASDVAATGQLALRKLRHADEELPLPARNGDKAPRPRTGGRAAKR